MVSADVAGDVVIPAAVALVGAFLAGLSAVMKTYFENRDARRATERQLDLAMKRTDFVEKWITVSRSFGEHEGARRKAIAELNEAYQDAQDAIHRSQGNQNSVVRQLRFLLMLERRNNLVSYVVSGLFLFTTVAAWFVLCVPEPGFEFSTAGAIVGSIFVTLTLRVLADVIVRGLEGFSRSRARKRTDRHAVGSPSPGSAPLASVTPGSTGASEPPSGEDAQESPAAPDVVPLGAVADQLRALAMMRPRKNKVSYFVSALFLLSLPVVSLLVVGQTTSGASSDGSPRCVGYYFGGYFGEVVPPGYPLYEDQLVTVDFEPYGGVGPRYFGWTGTEIQIDEFEQEYVIDVDGNKYAIDQYYGDTYYYDGTTRLTTQRGLDIDDPCDPVTVSVKTITRDSEGESASDLDDPDSSFPAFSYFDQENNFNQTDLYLNSGGTSIEAYFGADGRLMPVCSDDKQSLYTCIERSDVYYDSGAYYFIRRMVVAGFLIIGYAIAARLVVGLVVLGLERLSAWRSKRRGGAPIVEPEGVPQGV